MSCANRAKGANVGKNYKSPCGCRGTGSFVELKPARSWSGIFKQVRKEVKAEGQMFGKN